MYATPLIPSHEDSIGGGETNSTRRKYVHQILTIKGSPTNSNLGDMEPLESKIAFFEKDTTRIQTHDNDPMIIIVRCTIERLRWC